MRTPMIAESAIEVAAYQDGDSAWNRASRRLIAVERLDACPPRQQSQRNGTESAPIAALTT